MVTGERLEPASDGKPFTPMRLTPDRIDRTIRQDSGRLRAAKMFIDATYEGDLMAAARVTYTVGREAETKYGETLNGVQGPATFTTTVHREGRSVREARRSEERPALRHRHDPLPKDGEGDKRLQAYCFRMCMTNVAENSVPFPKPADYDEAKYELLFRNFEAGDMRLPLKIDMLPNGKTDTNNNCAVSTDYIGQNYEYPERATPSARRSSRSTSRTRRG